MKILILPDSFKNCLSSVEVGQALSDGIHRVFPTATIEQFPVADGGEGTVEAFVAASKGSIIKCKTHDALGREIEGFYGLLPDGTAVIEMAAASGIQLLTPDELNPMITTTYGTGELILSAITSGASQIILGLGGSVTNDGGVGMAQALGYRFLDSNGNAIDNGGGALANLMKIDSGQVSDLIRNTTFRIACDVQNPLTGPEGASAVYGPQKGATPEVVQVLDNNLNHLADIINKDLNIQVKQLPGGGAAGGMGAGAVAFLGGQLIPGFHIVTDVLHLNEKVKQADVIITGEGKIDAQTLQGKTPFAVAQLAQKYNKKLIAFAGYLGDNHRMLYDHGFDAIFPIAEKPMNLDDSIMNAKALLSNAAERAFRMIWNRG